MPIDYDALRGDTTIADHPQDGNHQARLDRAALVDTTNGERLVTEWTEHGTNVVWSSWNRFDQTGLTYTKELLASLGVKLSAVSDDASLQTELEKVTGHLYDVRTTSQQGSQGDRWFTNTYVDGLATGVQDRLTNGDAPIDTEGLADVKAQEEEIPF